MEIARDQVKMEARRARRKGTYDTEILSTVLGS